jgi:hypothetical protein
LVLDPVLSTDSFLINSVLAFGPFCGLPDESPMGPRGVPGESPGSPPGVPREEESSSDGSIATSDDEPDSDDEGGAWWNPF